MEVVFKAAGAEGCREGRVLVPWVEGFPGTGVRYVAVFRGGLEGAGELDGGEMGREEEGLEDDTTIGGEGTTSEGGTAVAPRDAPEVDTGAGAEAEGTCKGRCPRRSAELYSVSGVGERSRTKSLASLRDTFIFNWVARTSHSKRYRGHNLSVAR